MKAKPLVMAGPSGCGKSTLMKKLLAEFPDMFGFSVSRRYSKHKPQNEVNSNTSILQIYHKDWCWEN